MVFRRGGIGGAMQYNGTILAVWGCVCALSLLLLHGTETDTLIPSSSFPKWDSKGVIAPLGGFSGGGFRKHIGGGCRVGHAKLPGLLWCDIYQKGYRANSYRG